MSATDLHQTASLTNSGQFDDFSSDLQENTSSKCSSGELDNENIPNGEFEFEALEETDLSSSNLEVLPEMTIKDRLSVLTLDFNDLKSLPDSLGNCAPNLKILSVNGNQLESLPDSIGMLRTLEEIHANENSLESFPNSLCRLTKLRILKVTGNSVKKLPEDFGELVSLETLVVDENQLANLPMTFGLCEKLTTLEITNNKLQALPSTFGRLKNLKTLNLNSNKIEKLPENFGDLENLEFLDVSANQIENLPKYFKSCQCLRRVYLDTNSISELPNWVSELPHVIEFSAKDNKFTKQAVTEKFGHTNVKLKLLDLSGNFMTSLPVSLGELSELEELQLGSVIGELERRNFQNGNWISQLPSTFCRLVCLKHINLDENQLVSLPDDFGLLVNLEFLDLGQNMLHELPESFGGLRSLKVCLLSKNHLQLLPSTMGKLSALEDIRLDNNQIAELPESFENLVQLKTLDLFNNKLTQIPTCIEKFKNLVRLDIEENELGLPRQDVPMVRCQSKYPPRDPSLRDNWRGRPRQDLSNLDKTILQMEESAEEDSQRKEEEDSDKYSELQLELAARRNLASSSIWRSHEGPSVREKFVRGESSFQSWLARTSSFGNVTGDKETGDKVTSDEVTSETKEDFGNHKQFHEADDFEEEDDEDDSYSGTFSSRIGDWGSASEEEVCTDSQNAPVSEGEAASCEENWDEEIDEPFSNIVAAVPENHHPTWEAVHQPSKDLDTLFFAFDLHAPSVPRAKQYERPYAENGQFEDAEEDD